MKEQKEHTPGPWALSDLKSLEGECLVVAGEGHDHGLVAAVEMPVDARLIAAAPDLLTLAIRVESVICELAKLGRCPIILRALAVDFRAAIAKAQGVTSDNAALTKVTP